MKTTLCILLLILASGCVTVNKETNVYVNNPNVQIDAEVEK